MSEVTNFEDVKVGDRVRLTNVNGDLAEFTRVAGLGHCMESAHSVYLDGDGWQVEILEKPLPTKHNAMIGHPTDPTTTPYTYHETADAWFRHGSIRSEAEVRTHLREEGFVILFEGIDS